MRKYSIHAQNNKMPKENRKCQSFQNLIQIRGDLTFVLWVTQTHIIALITIERFMIVNQLLYGRRFFLVPECQTVLIFPMKETNKHTLNFIFCDST